MYNFDQYLFNEEKDPTQDFGLFGRFAIADEEPNTADHFYSIWPFSCLLFSFLFNITAE